MGERLVPAMSHLNSDLRFTILGELQPTIKEKDSHPIPPNPWRPTNTDSFGTAKNLSIISIHSCLPTKSSFRSYGTTKYVFAGISFAEYVLAMAPKNSANNGLQGRVTLTDSFDVVLVVEHANVLLERANHLAITWISGSPKPDHAAVVSINDLVLLQGTFIKFRRKVLDYLDTAWSVSACR